MSEHPADTALRSWVVGDDCPVAPKEVAAFRAGWSAAAAEIEDLRDQLDRTTQAVCILGPQRDEARDAARWLYDNGDVDKFIRWFFVRLAKTDHACMTGDCGHNDGNDCVQAVKNAYVGDCDERIGTSTETDENKGE
jgi:hypothetical protein